MFYKVFDQIQSPFVQRGYDDIFWMEHDVTPVQKHWIHELERRVQEDYMMQGSVYVGDAKHAEVAGKAGMLWLVHINGNALYNVRSPCLKEIVKRARHDVLNAFDIEIQKQLFAWATTTHLESYRLFQQCIHLYKYTEMILNCVGGRCVRPFSTKTYFAHGNAFSTAGNYTKG